MTSSTTTTPQQQHHRLSVTNVKTQGVGRGQNLSDLSDLFSTSIIFC